MMFSSSRSSFLPKPFLYICASLIVLCLAFSCNVANAFSAENYGLDEITQGGVIAAYGDFNGDKHTDIFVAFERTIQVYLFRTSNNRYEKLSLTTEPDIDSKAPKGPITGLVPGDFNYDGRLDLAVIGRNEATGRHWVYIYTGDLDKFFPNPTVLSPEPYDQPLVMDANNDLHLDFFGVADVEVAGVTVPRRVFWLFEALEKTNVPGHAQNIKYKTEVMELPTGFHHPFLAVPMASATVDMDGDCRADLFVVGASKVEGYSAPNAKQEDRVSLQYEIWINTSSKWGKVEYRLERSWIAPEGSGVPTFSDINADGTIDIVIPYCYPAHNCRVKSQLHIYYNRQQPVCQNSINPEPGCRKQHELCTRDGDFTFADISVGLGLEETSDLHALRDVPAISLGSPHPTDGLHVIVDSAKFFPTTEVVFASPFIFSSGEGVRGITLKNPPLQARFADTDLNSFPDLLIPLAGNMDKNNAATRRVELWRSVECTAELCTEDAVRTHARTFQPTEHENIRNTPGAYAASGLDIGNKGKVDIIALSIDPTSKNPKAIGFQNESVQDAYFMTHLPSNGVCPAWCKNGPEFPNPKPYGVSFPGASVKFTVSDLEGTKTAKQTAHIPQSAYLALSTPYIVSGTGRTANYVEEYFVGYTIAGSPHWNLWVAMIPNSQLVAFPYPPDNSAGWSLELFVSPSLRLKQVIIALLVSLVLIGITIGILHLKEKNEDQKNKKANHQFRF